MQLIVTVHVKKCLQLTFMETHFSVLHGGGAAKFSTATEVKPPRRYFTCVTCVEEMGEVLRSS